MTKKLFLMQGVPGSGKSTIADSIALSFNTFVEDWEDEDRAIILSTDNWRYREWDNTYDFDPAKNATFHHECQKACIKEMQNGREIIIIDNTNIQEWQARPYIELAKIFEYSVTVVSVDCGLDEAIRRQEARTEDRRVPAEVITDMYRRMERVLT